MEALADFDVTVTFCFTPEHLGHRAAPHQPAERSAGVRRLLRVDDRPLRAGGRERAVAPPQLPQESRSTPPNSRPFTSTATNASPPNGTPHEPSRPSAPINVAIVGVGNCASSLVQGIAHYSNGGANEQIGLSHWELGGYRPKDIKVVAAWDIDRRKVGRDVAEAIFAPAQLHRGLLRPCAADRHDVRMGKVLDGVAEHMADFPDERTFMLADGEREPTKDEVVEVLRETEPM